MFLLSRTTLRGALRIKNYNVLSKSTKLRTCDWSTFSCNFHGVAYKKRIVNLCSGELVSCKYSNTVNENTGVVAEMSSNEDEEDVSAMTTEALFAEIANGDPQVLRQLKILQFEIEVLRETESRVPSVIKKFEWLELLSLPTVNRRRKYLTFLFKNEKKCENKKMKRMQRKEQYLKMLEEGINSDPMAYTLSSQSLFLRIYDKSMSLSLRVRNLLNAEIAQNIVFDCSYQEYMSSLNSRFCAIQLQYCLNLHLLHRYPCLIRLCNLKKGDELYNLLPRYITTIFDNNFPWPLHEESYLDIYPRDKLVYLTPHCLEPLRELNPGDVYIIGAFVDKGMGVKASLARAKENQIRMARLPLDEYIVWKKGTKSLPLNIVLKILLDMKFFGDWSKAFSSVPRRHYEEYENEFKNPNDLLF